MRTNAKTWLVMAVFLSAMAGTSLGEKTIYVDADALGANAGTTWEHAYKFLQDALADANSSPKPVEIRVAQGTYRPDEDTLHPDGTGDRTTAFQLINSVTLKGGYAGAGSTDPNNRDTDLYETILTGDLDGDDGPDFANNSENSFHIFYHPEGLNLDDTAVLDAFTITAGNSSHYGRPHHTGGGMCNYESSPTVANCTFSGNSARFDGGGMYNYNYSSPTVTNCTFTSNSALWFGGGGMYNYNYSSPTVSNCTFSRNLAGTAGAGMVNVYHSTATVTNCTFSGNSADYGAGGMDNGSSSPTVSNCTFSENSADYGGGMANRESSPRVTNCTFRANSAVNNDGGGMYNVSSGPTVEGCTFIANSAYSEGGGMSSYYHSNPTVINCTFSANSAFYGAGMHNDDSNPTVTNCAFRENSADDGAGMYNESDSNPRVTNCTFSGNSSGDDGGGMCNYESGPRVTNCTFSANSADYGGGMANYESSPRVTNCTFSANSADYGGGMYNSNWESSPRLTNCILWENVPSQISGDASVSYCDVQGGWPGTGNIDANPSFVDDFHLRPDSACINAGDPTFVAEPNDVDMDGELRVMLGRVDMGTDEFNPFAAQFVVVRKERVERTIFEYECEVMLENISRFAVKNVSLEMARASANMTMIDSEVSFADAEIPPGGSLRSIDTCTFTVDRATAIDPAGIIWRVTAELADTGGKIEHTLASMPPVGTPEAGFEYLARLAEQWLWVGTPGGIEEDTIPDGTVNLADFAEFAAKWRSEE